MLNKVNPFSGVSAGAGLISRGTAVFSNSNGVSFGANGSTITASIATSLTNINFSAGGASANLSNVVFSNSNGLAFGLNGSTVTGSYTVPTVPAQFSGGDSTGGNTAGNSGVVTGQLVLAGGNNITLSGSTNGGSMTLTISGANAGGAQTAISGVVVSDTTYTSGTISFSNAGNVTISSSVNGATQYVRLSVAGQTNQSAIKAFGASNTGNTAGNTGVSTGIDWVVAATNSLTVSESTAVGGPNTLWLSVGAYLTTADLSQNSSKYVQNWKLTGNTAGTTSSAQGTDLWFSGGNSITVSGSSNSIVFSVGNYITTADLSQNSSDYFRNWKLTGNTAGTTSSKQGTDFWLAGGNGVTISGSSNTISFSVANQSNQSAIKAFGASNTGNTAGNTGVSTGVDWVLAATNSLTVSESTAAGGPNTLWLSVGAYLTTAALSGDTSKYVQNWKLTGNTAGTTSSAQGTDLWFSGGANVTVSGSSNTIVISGGGGGGASLGVSNTGNTAGNTGTSSGIVFAFAGSNNITASQSTAVGGPNTIWMSGPTLTQYLTTAALSGDTSKYMQNWKLTGNTSGTTSSAEGTDLWFSGGNSITVSGSSNTIVLSVGNYITTAALSGDTSKYMQAWELEGNNTAGTTSSLQGTKLYLSGGNNITLSGNSNTIVVSAFNQSNQTEGIYLTGNTTANSSSRTVDARSLSISGAGAVSVGWDTAASQLVISGGTAAVGSLSFYGLGNTTGTSSGTGAGTLSINASGALSVAASNSGWNLSVPNTSSLSATGWVQISTNGSTISIGATTTANLYAVGNTFGTSSGTADIRTVSISAGSGLQIAASNSGWVIGEQLLSFYEPNPFDGAKSVSSSAGLGTLNVFPFVLPYPGSFNQVMMIQSHTLTSTTAANTATVSIGNSTQSFNYQATYTITNSHFADIILFSKGTGGFSTNLFTAGSTRNSFVTFETHTYNISATRSSISLSSSVSVVVSFPAITSATSTSVNAATTITVWGTGYSSWTSSISTSNSTTGATGATTSISQAGAWPATTAWASYKLVNMNFATSLSGGEWWIGLRRQSSTSSSSSSASTNGNANATFTISVNASNLTLTANISSVGFTNSIASSLGTIGGGVINSIAPWPVQGIFSNNTWDPGSTYVNNAGQPNGAIAMSDVVTTNATFWRPWVQFANYRI